LVFALTYCQPGNRNNNNILDIITNISKYKTYFSYPDRTISLEKRLQVQNRIIELIDSSQKEIRVFAYGFVGDELIQSLERAKNRGIKIYFWGNKDSDYTPILDLGISIIYWNNVAIQHSKVLVIDQKNVFLGTGNFTHYGLLHDWNYYLEFDLKPDQAEGFLKYLEESDPNPTRKVGSDTFYSSPKYGKYIQDIIITSIDSSQSKIDYLIFDHFDTMISLALQMAAERGVTIRGIYNSPVDVEGKKLANFLRDPKNSIWEEKNEDYYQDEKGLKGGLLHHKSMTIDDKIILVGSYNYSISARDKNREVLLESNDLSLIRAFQEEWKRVESQSKKLEKGDKEFPFSIEEKIQIEWNKDSFRFRGITPNSSFVIRLISKNGSSYGWVQYPRKSGEYPYSAFHDSSSGIFSRGGNSLLYQMNWEKGDVIFPSLQKIYPLDFSSLQKKPNRSKTSLEEYRLESKGMWIRHPRPLNSNGMIFTGRLGWMNYIYNRTDGEWKFIEWDESYSIREGVDFLLLNEDRMIIHSPKKESREEWMDYILTNGL
jgi:phosphatidylserine/phosphatidylglycerophosphate/cardiolipin synthase-like enzyme